MANDINKLTFLMLIINGKRRASALSFESLVCTDNLENLSMMIAPLPLLEDEYLCETTQAQKEVEDDVKEVYEGLFAGTNAKSGTSVTDVPLNVDKHLGYIERYLKQPLPSPYYVLDANHSWMMYWLLNSHVVLSGEPVSPQWREQASISIKALVIDDGKGGIAGGPNGQIGHMALTYAAVLLLALIEDFQQLATVRDHIYQWLLSLKHADGSFAMHLGGERDTRSTYCALVIASLLGIESSHLFEGTANWILSCQTYEGGFAGVPYAEAHGGYTFCAVASLFLLGMDMTTLDTDLLLRWLVARQLQVEGGFSGRTNKLVDACYSFWVGAALALVESVSSEPSMFNRSALKSYILNCCQEPTGGLRDKIGKSPDFYHTNYTLCGLSLAEHIYEAESVNAYGFTATESIDGAAYTSPINPVFGLPLETAEKCRRHFIAQ